MRRRDDPTQTLLAFLVPNEVIPQADGSVLVRPGKPVATEWLTAKQLGGEFGRSEDAVYRWRQEGLIPENMVRFAGKREMLFRADARDHLRDHFSRLHGV